MKKLIYITLAAFAGFMLASCGENTEPETVWQVVLDTNYSSLVRGQESGEAVVVLPVSATSEDGTLNLNFFNTIPFLAPGTYTVGEGVGFFNGHFNKGSVDGDINNGSITVTLDGVKDYKISGTVRLKDAENTIVKVRAAGVLEYDIPTNYYYTEEASEKANGVSAHIYRLYEKETSYQVAEIAVVGDDLGDYAISASGDAGTAVYGSPTEGCRFYDPSYGTYVMIHGGVSLSRTFPGRLNFSFTDRFNYTDNPNVDFLYCEKKDDLVPAVRPSTGDMSFMMLHFYSVESPVVDGMYEFTVKMNYTAGDEFISFTAITDTPNPILEPLQKDGDSTGGVAFSAVSYADYLSGNVASKKAVAPTCFYVWEGERYAVPFDQGFAIVMNAQRAQGIVAGLLAPTNMSYSLPEPLLSGMAAKGLSIWNLMGYSF